MAAIVILSYKRPVLLKRLLTSFLSFTQSLDHITSLFILDSTPKPFDDDINAIFHSFYDRCPIDCHLLSYSPDLHPFSKLIDALSYHIQDDYIHLCADDDLYFFDNINLLCESIESTDLDFVGGIDIRYDSNKKLSHKSFNYPFDTIHPNRLTRLSRITNSPFPIAYGLFRRESLIPVLQHTINFSSLCPDKSFAEYCYYFSFYLQSRALFKPLVTQLRDTRPSREWDFSSNTTVKPLTPSFSCFKRLCKGLRYSYSAFIFPSVFIITLPYQVLFRFSLVNLFYIFILLLGFSFRRLMSSFNLYSFNINVDYIGSSNGIVINNKFCPFDAELLKHL